jgi:hypothetical protein
MTFVPHYRVSCIGRLGEVLGPEQFSFGFALDNVDPQIGDVPGLNPNDAVWTDVANDCAAYFSHADTGIHEDAVLTMVKIAHIGADGKYLSAPVEKPVNAQGAGALRRPSNSTALAVTLKTNGDLGRVKGRFYLPLPEWVVEEDGRYSQAAVDYVEGRSQTFINNINNQPGFDVLGLRVVVASQGRRNKDGSLRRPPTNHDVVGVSVGRVPDTIRRRRNKLLEQHQYRPIA